MKMGTKSVLFGAHQFMIHPWFVAAAWAKLYGWRQLTDPRLWLAFFLHDLGYWGMPNMDGPEGEWHPAWGAGIMGWLFDELPWFRVEHLRHLFGGTGLAGGVIRAIWGTGAPSILYPYGEGKPSTWYNFCFYHSRYLAKKYNSPPSRLCYADKFAFCITWSWLYRLLVSMTGEWREYATAHAHEVHANAGNFMDWYLPSKAYVLAWVSKHIDGSADTWTKAKSNVVARVTAVGADE